MNLKWLGLGYPLQVIKRGFDKMYTSIITFLHGSASHLRKIAKILLELT